MPTERVVEEVKMDDAGLLVTFAAVGSGAFLAIVGVHFASDDALKVIAAIGGFSLGYMLVWIPDRIRQILADMRFQMFVRLKQEVKSKNLDGDQ